MTASVHTPVTDADAVHVGEESHASHRGTYFTVFAVLCVLTALSVAADMLQLSNPFVLRAIILAVATSKALCVMLFFMHLKFEKAWKYLLLGPTLILAGSIPLALLSDVGIHYYTVESPQRDEYEAAKNRAEAGNSDHAPAH